MKAPADLLETQVVAYLETLVSGYQFVRTRSSEVLRAPGIEVKARVSVADGFESTGTAEYNARLTVTIFENVDDKTQAAQEATVQAIYDAMIDTAGLQAGANGNGLWIYDSTEGDNDDANEDRVGRTVLTFRIQFANVV